MKRRKPWKISVDEEIGGFSSSEDDSQPSRINPRTSKSPFGLKEVYSQLSHTIDCSSEDEVYKSDASFEEDNITYRMEEVNQIEEIEEVAVITENRNSDSSIQEYASDAGNTQTDNREVSNTPIKPSAVSIKVSPSMSPTNASTVIQPSVSSKTEIFEESVDLDESIYERNNRNRNKGSLTQRLQRLIAREESDLLFWKHDKRKNVYGENIVWLRVLNMEDSCSIVHLSCMLFDSTQISILLPQSVVKIYKIKENHTLALSPPWKKFFCNVSNRTVLLCTYFIQVQSTTSALLQPTQSAHDISDFTKSNQDRHMVHHNINIVSSNKETTTSDQEQQHLSILQSVEKSRVSHSLSFSCRIQRVLCKVVRKLPNSNQPFVQRLSQSNEKTLEMSYVIFVQDNLGTMAEVEIPETLIKNNSHWSDVIANGEGRCCTFKKLNHYSRKSIKKKPSYVSFIKTFMVEDPTKFFQEWDGGQQNIQQYLYVFNVDPSSSQCDFIDVPSDFDLNYIAPNHTPCLSTCRGVVSSTLQLVTMTTDDDVATIIDHVYGYCHQQTCDVIHKVRVHPLCYVPPVVQKKCSGVTVVFKDMFVEGDVIADTFTRVEFKEEAIFKSCRPPSLTDHSKEGDICLVAGLISGINEETAFFWTVCNQCDGDEIESTQNGAYCEHCKSVTTTRMKMQLDIFLYLPHLNFSYTLCKLRQETIDELLPLPEEDNFEGFDMKGILKKPFGPSVVSVTDITEEQGCVKVTLKEAVDFLHE